MTSHQVSTETQKGSQDWIQTIQEGKGYTPIAADTYRKLLQNISEYSFFRTLKKYVKPGDKVLEAGCGWAFSSFALASKGISVTPVDISGILIANLITLKRELGQPYDQCLSPVEGDIFKLDQIVEKQDVIFSDGTYEHFTEDERCIFLQKITESLSAGGKFIISVPNLHNPFFRVVVGNKMPLCYPFTMKSLSQELIVGGFQIEEKGYSFVNPGFEQWVKSTWMIIPIRMVNRIFRILPKWIKIIFCAHFYCVARLSNHQSSNKSST